MARKPTTNAAQTSTELDVAGAHIFAGLEVIKVGERTVNVANILPAGIAYLLNYGMAKSLQDSVAGMAKDLKAEGRDEAAIAAAIDAKHAERWNAIVAGEMAVGGARGPRKVGIDSVMHDVAVEALKVAYAANKITFPAKAADVNAMVEKYLAKHGDKARTEAERRMATTTAEVIDLNDL